MTAQLGPNTILLLSHVCAWIFSEKSVSPPSPLSTLLKSTLLGFSILCISISRFRNPKIWVNNLVSFSMDSRDSLSSVASDAARDASSLSEDASVISVTSALAKYALSCFQSGKFEECIETLIQLDQKKHNDPKVQIFFFFLGFNSFS